ncbi:hypothetical protein ACFWN7_07690 [Agromyces sp. NPDC058484]|uniref:hypothetical protein n=1 Tax=Agromyces sp. NPDC058484 TaxID=3346524 RepID=UPI00365E35F8
MNETRAHGVMAFGVIAMLSLGLVGCVPSTGAESNGDPAASHGGREAEVPDLTGEWTQADPTSPESYQAATIEGGTIVVDWVSDGGDTRSLYWAGTFVAPTAPGEPYTWNSQNDTAQTDAALLASSDPTKTFIYENGVISYEVTALGTTTMVALERVEE